MCELLDDALVAGAMGLSSNFLDFNKYERPLPTQQPAMPNSWPCLPWWRYPGATIQVIIDYFMRKTANASLERFGRLAREAAVRLQWVGMPTLEYMADQLPRAEGLHAQFKAEGLDIFASFNVISPTSLINFNRPLVFGQNGNPVWRAPMRMGHL